MAVRTSHRTSAGHRTAHRTRLHLPLRRRPVPDDVHDEPPGPLATPAATARPAGRHEALPAPAGPATRTAAPHAPRRHLMLHTVATKTLRDQRRALGWWSLSLALLVGMYVAIWPSIRDQPSMNDFLDQMPEAFRAMFASSGADMSTPVGYIQVELLSFMGPILLLLYTVTSGSGALAGEEDRRTMDLLLSAPVSRTKVVLSKLAAMVAGTALLAGVLALAAIVEGSWADMDLPVGNIVAAMVHLGLLGLVFGTLALAVGGVTGQPGLSRAMPAVVAVLAYVLNGLAPIVDWLEPYQKLSPFYQYIGHDPLRHGLSTSSVLVAVATVAVLTAVAVVGFRRRDVRT